MIDLRSDTVTRPTEGMRRAMVEEGPEPERTALAPTFVAHRTQVNQHATHYARYWPAAVAVIDELTGTDTGLEAAAGAC